MKFQKEEIELLRKRVATLLSKKRFSHTLGVARCAVMLSEFCGEDKSEAEAAALLHDITKEYSSEKQLEILGLSGITLDDEDILVPKIWHAYTAPYIIKRDFGDFATPNVLNAVYNHTIGHPKMTVFDEIIFLADFIEDTRPYEPSVRLREFVLDKMVAGETERNIRTLHFASIRSIDATISHLLETGQRISIKNVLTKNALKSRI